jgi:hypothetical protein
LDLFKTQFIQKGQGEAAFPSLSAPLLSPDPFLYLSIYISLLMKEIT